MKNSINMKNFNIIIAAVERIEQAGWFEDLNKQAQQKYIKENPNSKYAKNSSASKTTKSNNTKETPPRKINEIRSDMDKIMKDSATKNSRGQYVVNMNPDAKKKFKNLNEEMKKANQVFKS